MIDWIKAGLDLGFSILILLIVLKSQSSQASLSRQFINFLSINDLEKDWAWFRL